MGRDVVFSGTFFWGWTVLGQLSEEMKMGMMDDVPSQASIVEQSLEAGVAAALAAFVSHPLDSARTRTQATVLPKVGLSALYS